MAEFGFFGVVVRTCVHTPRFCGDPLGILRVLDFNELWVKRRAGAFSLLGFGLRPCRTS